MKIDIIILLLLALFIVWVILHLSDRRRIVNGLVFLVAIGSFLSLLLYIGIKNNMRVLTSIIALIFLAIILLIPIAYVVTTILFISTGLELIKKEGLSLGHGLSFIFGLGVIFSTILYPLLLGRIRSRIVFFLLSFFLSCFIYFVVGFIIYYIASIIYKLYPVKKDKDYLIVLGSGLQGDKVTALLASRIDRAIEFYYQELKTTDKKPKIIMSGGQGPDEIISEARAMANYALEKGVDSEAIILEDRSKTTRENIKYSREVILEDGGNLKKVIFFTNNFHVFRASLLAKKENLNWNGLGSRTKIYYYISATIREYIAILFIHKKFNIFMGLSYALINALALVFSTKGL